MRRHSRAPRVQRGFTLIEIIAVLMLIALVITVASVSVTQGIGGARIRAAAGDLVSALRYTRGQAIVTRSEKTLELDVETRTYVAPKKAPVVLPGKMEMRLLTAAQERTGATSGKIRFYPDGSSTGGRIRLLSGERVWDVEIAWLTGEVQLRDGRDEP
jgi:general secretion pathway protein H